LLNKIEEWEGGGEDTVWVCGGRHIANRAERLKRFDFQNWKMERRYSRRNHLIKPPQLSPMKNLEGKKAGGRIRMP